MLFEIQTNNNYKFFENNCKMCLQIISKKSNWNQKEREVGIQGGRSVVGCQKASGSIALKLEAYSTS